MWSSKPIMISYWATPWAFQDRSDIYPRAHYFGYFDGKVITAYMPKDYIENLRWILEQDDFEDMAGFYGARNNAEKVSIGGDLLKK